MNKQISFLIKINIKRKIIKGKTKCNKIKQKT